MFFRRNEGEFRETDRVTRFKLIKSGKNWLRAATSNFGLFKVVKGGADAPSVTVQNVEEKSSLLSGTALLKGIAAAGAVAGGAVATTLLKPKKQLHQLWKAKQLQTMTYWQTLMQLY